MLPKHSNSIKTILGELQHIGILGFGMEGRSSYRIFRMLYPDATLHIFDQSESIEVPKDEKTILHLGDHYLSNINQCDVVMRSPGIKLNKEQYAGTITSQTQLFTQLCREQIIGVTGTKGKSTTTSMIHHLLSIRYDVALVGNIGMPVLDSLDHPYDYYVCEYSCHQLSDMTASPKYALLLNLFPEHLDYYASVEEYFDAKRNIHRYQKEGDFFLENVESNRVKSTPNGMLIDRIEIPWCPSLVGKHNWTNQLFATLVALELGLTPEEIAAQLSTFKGLPHRLEQVYRTNEQTIINDSISTIPQSTIAAIGAFDDVSAVLIGGFDRSIDYSELIALLDSDISFTPILFSQVGARIATATQNDFPYFDTFESAVLFTLSIHVSGTIIMSPGASSYDEFSSFAERGKRFKDLITVHFGD